MPQLIPYYFTNQNNVSFILLISLVYVFSMFILPQTNSLLLTRSLLFNI